MTRLLKTSQIGDSITRLIRGFDMFFHPTNALVNNTLICLRSCFNFPFFFEIVVVVVVIVC